LPREVSDNRGWTLGVAVFAAVLVALAIVMLVLNGWLGWGLMSGYWRDERVCVTGGAGLGWLVPRDARLRCVGTSVVCRLCQRIRRRAQGEGS